MVGIFSRTLKNRFDIWVEKRLPAKPQVTLNQSKIFIVPTLQGLLLLLVALLILLLAINFSSALNYALAFWLVAMLWVGIHQTYRNLSGLTITGVSGNLVEVGDVAEIVLNINPGKTRNRGVIEFIAQPWGVVQHHITGDSQNLTLELNAKQRGPLPLTRFRIESRYPFGLVVAWSYLLIDVSAWVYPVSKEFPRSKRKFDQALDSDALTDQYIINGSEDFHSLKSYQPGHSIHRLHWPSFARDELLVKHFVDYQSGDESIDWDDFAGLSEEDKLSAIAHFSKMFSENNTPFSVRLPTVDIPMNTGEEHLKQVRRALAEYGYV